MKKVVDPEHDTLAFLQEEIEEMCEKGIRKESELETLCLLLKTEHKLKEYMGKPEHRYHTGYADTADPHSKYTYVYAMLDYVLEHHPETWNAYIHKPGGHMDIIEMELGEMKKAYDGMKMNPPIVTHHDFIKELKHSASAIVFAIEAMTCKDKELQRQRVTKLPSSELAGSWVPCKLCAVWIPLPGKPYGICAYSVPSSCRKSPDNGCRLGWVKS